MALWRFYLGGLWFMSMFITIPLTSVFMAELNISIEESVIGSAFSLTYY